MCTKDGGEFEKWTKISTTVAKNNTEEKMNWK
jgi:hypothetical protein